MASSSAMKWFILLLILALGETLCGGVRRVAGITADEERCRRNAESTAALATVLAPRIGYDKAAEVAKRPLKEDKTLREVVLEMELMSASDLDDLLDFDAMTRPGVG